VDFAGVARNVDVLVAALGDLGLTLGTVLVGLPVALVVMLGRISRYRLLAVSARIYIEIFRDLPVLVVLIWLFYAVPALAGSGISFPPFVVALSGLALNFSALEAEVLRAGYEAIPFGQVEAGSALGLHPRQTSPS
jgi:polar amino acid transport system permease protein